MFKIVRQFEIDHSKYVESGEGVYFIHNTTFTAFSFLVTTHEKNRR
jgi:hypothetical protein